MEQEMGDISFNLTSGAFGDTLPSNSKLLQNPPIWKIPSLLPIVQFQKQNKKLKKKNILIEETFCQSFSFLPLNMNRSPSYTESVY